MKPERFSLRIDEEQLTGHVLTGPDERLWVYVREWGQTFSLAPAMEPSSRKGKGAGAKNQDGSLVAPMPGKILKIFKNPGEAVAAGETLVVMEAMKMEYSLKAAFTGTLAAVKVKALDQVTLGQVLVEVKKEAPQ